MSRLLAWPFLLTLAAALGSLALAHRLWQLRDRPGATWLLGTLASQTVFCVAYAAALTIADPGLRYALEVVAVASFHWLGVPFLGFALAYTGRSNLLDSWYFRLQFLFPLVATVLLPFNDSHGLFWTDFTVETAYGIVGASYTTQPLLFVTVLGGASAASVGTLLLLDTFLDYGPLYRTESFAVGVSTLPPTVGLLVWLFQVGPAPELNLTAILFVPHVLLDAYAFVWSDMFEYHPATKRAAERSAIEDLGSPVFVLDEQGRVVDVNDQARRLLADETDPITEPVEDVLGSTIDLGTEAQRLTLQREGQPRTYRVRPAPLTDSGDTHVGYTLVLQDITEEVRHEQRLSVLNRVLRHNLRNDMTVVKGNVAVAQERTDGGVVTEALATAVSTADDLIETSEKARTVAETIQEASDDIYRVDVASRCRTVAEHYREQYPEATLSVTGETELLAETSPTVLSTVLENLVENALAHGGERVGIRVERRSDDRVCLTVTDDGPGIPDSELATIREGEETDLQHGSGFGLWVAKWGAELLGGDLTFDVDGEGTAVTVSLTDQRAVEHVAASGGGTPGTPGRDDHPIPDEGQTAD